MKILHLYKDYLPVVGGIENHIRVLAEAEAAAGQEVTVAVCKPEKDSSCPRETIEHGVRVIRYPRIVTLRSMPLSLPYGMGVRCLAREMDVIHVHSPFPLGEAMVRDLSSSVRLLVTHHSDVVRQKLLLKFYAPLYRAFLRRADLILPTSEAYAKSSPWLQPHWEKCRVVPLGVDTRRFCPAPKASGSSAGLRIVFVGRFRYYKGVDTLLQAMTLLPENVSLTLVGDGPKKHEWYALSNALGLQTRVTFHGEVSDDELLAVYHSADLFVLPCNCRAEAFGTVLAEALSCGVPCITCEVGSGTSSVVRNGTTGYVVQPSDPKALATAIQAMLEHPEERLRMGLAARADALQRLSDEAMVRSVLQLLTE